MIHKLHSVLLMLLLACSAVALVAQSEPAPPARPIPLWPNGAPGALGHGFDDIPTITPFLADPNISTGASFIVCPGGGYWILADHEGSSIARWLNTLGISAFVLKYRHAPEYHYPAPILDAERAMRYVRSNAANYGLDPEKVGIIGFSAGGHVASTVGTHFDNGNPQAADPIDRVSDRPNLMILGYPVITMGPYTHAGSKKNLIGDHPSQQMVDLLSNEKHVTAQTPPTFLVQTVDDNVVPVENSLMFAEALKKAGVPFELHLFQHGPHGFGLADGMNHAPNIPYLAVWSQLAADWLKLHNWAR